MNRLTKTEHNVAILAGSRIKNREIASIMGSSEKTVKFHLTRIYKKLGITNRNEIIFCKWETFFFKFKKFQDKDGRTIINEVCYCGALKTEHENRLNLEGTKGHGRCVRTGCQRFTWVKFLYSNESVGGK